MKKTIIALGVIAILSGCATSSSIREKMTGEQFDEPTVEQNKYLKKLGDGIRAPKGGPITVAVYGFRDMTGQRKSVPNIASLSSAVTQGADSYLVKALQDVGNARWFTVVERVGLENLIKERQMIRQMREQYQGRDAKPLPPMLFAGVIIEGGIVGYDSNTSTGGSGARFLGIGAQTQYQSDTVTVNLRTVSVSTGEVLTSITVTKTVLSYMDKVGVLRFVSAGEQAIEAEIGASINESINKATNLAIQAAVIETINEGAKKGHWAFKDDLVITHPLPVQPEIKIEPMVEVKVEPKAEVKVEPKAEAKPEVKAEAKPEAKPEPTPAKVLTKKSTTRTTVRENDKAGSTILSILSPGDEVEVLREQGNMTFVQTKSGKKGWVVSNFLK